MANLFKGIEDARQHTQSFVKVMREIYGFNCVGFIHNGTTAVFEKQNTYYHVSDNGGEVNVCPVNNNDTVGIPFTSFKGSLNPCTIAYRVWKLITDGYGEIDWDWIAGSEEDKQGLHYKDEIDIAAFKPMLEEVDMDYLIHGR